MEFGVLFALDTYGEWVEVKCIRRVPT